MIGGDGDGDGEGADSEGSDYSGVIIGIAVGVAVASLVFGIVICGQTQQSAGGSDEGGRSGVATASSEDPAKRTDGFGFGADGAQGYLEVDGTQTKR